MRLYYSPNFYQDFHAIDGLKGPLLVYTNHINHEKPMHHGFLAPQVYLCSTSFRGKFFVRQSLYRLGQRIWNTWLEYIRIMGYLVDRFCADEW